MEEWERSFAEKSRRRQVESRKRRLKSVAAAGAFAAIVALAVSLGLR